MLSLKLPTVGFGALPKAGDNLKEARDEGDESNQSSTQGSPAFSDGQSPGSSSAGSSRHGPGQGKKRSPGSMSRRWGGQDDTMSAGYGEPVILQLTQVAPVRDGLGSSGDFS